ncbi:ParB N-terminal domain-containing protein [Acidiphilium sp. PA]|uniref:ParB/RepB/Spo0J family partition protein n=1 Tax=Acidiphilium sp. PA TaxID=2871705 RepID=UPI002243C6F8|nr:ParB N-terminal domain-containing protein [Acidiphilium sp. PA]MCW8305591.1 ParB N-terminal domain-containing protein [Acidiphilium sp. PA]
MSDPVLTVPMSQIEVSDRLRIVDQAEVQKLAVSISKTKQISPVEVRAIAPGQYRLVAGAYRIAAIKSLGQTQVRAVLFEGNDDEARLREIDENLYRQELSPFDQAEFLAERRIVWE